MSTPDPDLHDESLSRLYRQLPAAEPSAATDAAILAAARGAVATSGVGAPASRWRRYRAPFALAATVVLAVTVLLRTETPEEAALPAAVESAARDMPASDAPVVASAPVEESRVPAPVTTPAEARARQAAPVTMAGEPAPAYAPPPAAAQPDAEAEAMSLEDRAPAVAAGSAPKTEAAADRLAPASPALNAAPAPQRKAEALAERAPMEAAKSRVAVAWPFAIAPGTDPDDACARLARATPPLACTRDDGRVHVAFDGLAGSGLFAGATLLALEMDTDGNALRYTARSTDGTLPARLLAQLAAEGWSAQSATTDTVRRTIGNRAWQVRVNGDGEVVSLVATVVP